MNSIRFLLRISILLLVARVNVAVAETKVAPKFNVLFIASDDLNCHLGCYGDPQIKSPNIDRLAAQGVKFDRAYCQFPLCNPSRVSLLTGLRPRTTKVWDLKTNIRSIIPRVETLPQMYRRYDYFVARVGKIFHYGVPRQIGSGGMDDPDSWDLAINPRGYDKDNEKDAVNLTPQLNGLGFSMSYLETPNDTEPHTDEITTAETIRLMERYKDKQFFIGAGYYRPHVPEVAPKRFYDLYPLDTVKLPANPPEHLKNIPKAAFHIHPSNYGIPEKDLREFTRGYYASTSFVDEQVGKLLDAVKRLGLADRTIIVFWSDHGWLLGEHGQWQKQLLFEESVHVPLIFYVPGAKGNGTACPRTVELLDIFPTLADLCDMAPPKNLEGKSLKPLLENPSAEWNHPAISQVTRKEGKGRSVHTERWRYTEWNRGKDGAELYDHDKDPHELHNLANDPAQKETIEKLKKYLPEVWDEK
jgi:uncharacterized sulfatase